MITSRSQPFIVCHNPEAADRDAAIRAERTSNPHLSAEHVVLGYKQSAVTERAWRDMKHVIDLRQVDHRLEDRVRAHVLPCWLALLLVRIIESRTGQTWHHLRPALQRLHAGTFTGPPAPASRPRAPTPRACAVSEVRTSWPRRLWPPVA